MPNGFEHPLSGEESPQAVKQLIEEIAAEAARIGGAHDHLDRVRSMLKDESLAAAARTFAFLGSPASATRPGQRYELWKLCQSQYVDWRMANDDDFWAALHRGLDEPHRFDPNR
jgi:hypothetical protein